MKRLLLIIYGALLCLVLASCANEPRPDLEYISQAVDSSSEADLEPDPEEGNNPEISQKEQSEAASSSDGLLIETDYGSYLLPNGWYKFDQISTPEKPFYLKEGIGTESVISNISVECGKNKYAKEDHLEFRAALVRQLGAQAAAMSISMEAGGSYTAAGDVLYVFTISDDKSSTAQYYIIGDNRYVLIHVTDFMDERIPDVNETAAAMADSFAWA